MMFEKSRSIKSFTLEPNRDLSVLANNKARWTNPGERRHGLHNLHRVARYVMSFRSADVWKLFPSARIGLASLPTVRLMTSLPCFSAMVVLQGDEILFEDYARDFSPDSHHSIQSITKTMMNLVIGRLVEEGAIDLSRSVRDYLPEIGSGYADATVQQVLNMDVVNEYSEDFSNPSATYYAHEEAMGWRLPADRAHEDTQRAFVARLTSTDTRNMSGYMQYKDANTDILGWVAERATGRSLRSFLADIVDAAGLEHPMHITTDREGFPTLDGGACLTPRDLARYFSIFARLGLGVDGRPIGSASFLDRTLADGIPIAPPRDHQRYSNHLAIYGRSVGHSGWGGQYALANPATGIVAVFLSAIEDAHGADRAYLNKVSAMLEEIVELNEQP
ncbi:serine hydrolase domain-containing protein [Sphingosinicella rhizophila]|uniref:Serine hydrolase n=1 Tax=Sphingosinicella rhizophila TaxID=3050082 RepID=A0ABU3Q4K3_9SPHN|nr:serine hydrolase [Sphingosinicella sp. GR2756]MDT9598350.1 serine hydrolase [Sphingosinicella sp. GR2756]